MGSEMWIRDRRYPEDVVVSEMAPDRGERIAPAEVEAADPRTAVRGIWNFFDEALREVGIDQSLQGGEESVVFSVSSTHLTLPTSGLV